MNILVIGNGFDLAHELPTSYPDFLGFCRMLIEVYDINKTGNADEIWDELGIRLKREVNTNRLKMKFSELYSISHKECDGECIHTYPVYDELYSNIDENFWISYFLQNSIYKKDNWIDFESEISKIIQSIDKDRRQPNDIFSALEDEVGQLEDEYVEDYFAKYDIVNKIIDESKCNLDNITYEVIRNKLYIDLNRLIRALEIYLKVYVEKIDISKISPDIEDIVMQENLKGEKIICNVLSFNYSNTCERIYLSKYVEPADVYMDYIHGKADVSNNLNSNNMVLGIDEYLPEDRKNKEVEFIAFKKFYQRIYKETGCKYKEWVDEIKAEYEEYMHKRNDAVKRSMIGPGDGMYALIDSVAAKTVLKTGCNMHHLYIYGHSLDVTDGDILKDLILNDNVYTTIFYLNKDVMGQQIANLVKVIGQDELIKRTGGNTKTIEFRQQQDMLEVIR